MTWDTNSKLSRASVIERLPAEKRETWALRGAQWDEYTDDERRRWREWFAWAVGPRGEFWDSRRGRAVVTARYLRCADLSRLPLAGVVFDRCNLMGANFDHADLTGADLSSCALEHARFNRACLIEATLSNARLDHADFTGADLSDARIHRTDLTRLDFRDARLFGTRITEPVWNFVLPRAAWNGAIVFQPGLFEHPVSDVQGLPPILRRQIGDIQHLRDMHRKAGPAGRLVIWLWGVSCGFGHLPPRARVPGPVPHLHRHVHADRLLADRVPPHRAAPVHRAAVVLPGPLLHDDDLHHAGYLGVLPHRGRRAHPHHRPGAALLPDARRGAVDLLQQAGAARVGRIQRFSLGGTAPLRYHAPSKEPTMRCTLALLAAAAVAPALLAQTVTCDADATGTETMTQLWDAPRPLAFAAAYTPRLTNTFLSLNIDPEGDGPREVAITPDGQTALVVNMGVLPASGGTLSFIDIPTRVVTGSVNLGQLPVHVAVSPNGRYAVVPNVFSHTVSVIDLATRTVLHTVPVTGTQPFRAAVTPDSLFAVVSVTNDAINSAFSVIDLAAGVEVRSIPTVSQGSIGFYATPEFGMSGPLFTQFALTPDGARAVFPHSVNTTTGAINIYTIATGAAVSIPTPASGRSVDISPDGARAVIGHEGSTVATRVVSVVDLTTNTLLASHPVASMLGSQTIKITPDNSHAIAAISNNTIFVDLASGVTDATISTGSVGEIEILGNFAFVSNFNSSVINWTTRTLVTTLPLAACVETAVTPVGNRVVTLNSRFREDAQFYTIGATNSADGFVASGPQPEGDCTKMLAITADGDTLIACNTISRNASVVDLATSSVRATIPTGDRVSGVNTTPDSRYAVVANSDQSTVTIIDLDTDTAVATLPIATRPWHVAMSPNGPLAAVLTVAGTDMIHWINVNGAASNVAGTTIAGQTGNILAYTYAETSGIGFNPAGTILAVCRSFDDQVRLIDAATRTVITDVTVGDFPMAIGFTPDGTRAYVTNAFSNNISVVNINGAASATIATIPGFNSPLFPVVDAAGAFVYINNQGTNPRISVVSTATNAVVANVTLSGGNPRDLALAPDGTLYAAGADASGGRLYVLSAAGAATAVTDSIALSGSPFDLALAPGRPVIAVSQPVPDGVDLVSITVPCDPDFNCDGNADQDDVACIINAVAGNPGCECQDADFNRDGNVDQDDVAALINVVAGGECP